MPNYDFECKACGEIYEEITSYDEKGKYPKVSCPECKSKKKTRLMCAPAFNFTNPEGTKRWSSESGGHDYRYKHTGAPKAQAQRAYAQQNSHVGPNPYGDG